MAAVALLFDLDGTIWDSYPWYAKRLAGAAALPEKEALARLRSGDSIIKLLKEFKIAESRLSRHCNTLNLFPGVIDALPQLIERGTLIGAVTSLPGRLVVPMLEGTDLSRFFTTIIHAGNYHRRKPHPGPLLAALKQLSVDTEGAFYIGDMPTDAEAAFRAGVSFAWASYGYGTLCPATATMVLRRFSDVLLL